MDSAFLDTIQALDIALPSQLDVVTDILESISAQLAHSDHSRKNLGTADPKIWPTLRALWNRTADALVTDPAQGEDADDRKNSLRGLVIALARFTRNLVAGVKENQEQAFEVEPDIRKMLYHQTSFVVLRDEESHLLTRLLTQTLSNIVTYNDTLMSRLWSTYIFLPEEQTVFIRLLDSPDERTILTTFVMITNCIHRSKERAAQLMSSPTGSRLCVRLLDSMLRLYDAEEDSDSGKAFDVGYSIFTRIIEFGLAPTLYAKLAIESEPVSPNQIILLKLLDSYLESTEVDVDGCGKRELASTLSAAFCQLSTWACEAIRGALGLASPPSSKETQGAADWEVVNAADGSERGQEVRGDGETNRVDAAENDDKGKGRASTDTVGPLREIDPLLPKACEALVLVTQCTVSIALDARPSDARRHEHERGRQLRDDESGWVTEDDQENEVTGLEVRSMVNDAVAPNGQGLIECLIELLRLVDLFLPRINFGKPVRGPGQPSPDTTSPTEGASAVSPPGFSYLKRDLVRLLGILSHANVVIQDRVRVCDGIPVVMSLCVIDERNPFLREHAIFTLRNLLEDNAENQAVVDALKRTKV